MVGGAHWNKLHHVTNYVFDLTAKDVAVAIYITATLFLNYEFQELSCTDFVLQFDGLKLFQAKNPDLYCDAFQRGISKIDSFVEKFSIYDFSSPLSVDNMVLKEHIFNKFIASKHLLLNDPEREKGAAKDNSSINTFEIFGVFCYAAQTIFVASHFVGNEKLCASSSPEVAPTSVVVRNSFIHENDVRNDFINLRHNVAEDCWEHDANNMTARFHELFKFAFPTVDIG